MPGTDATPTTPARRVALLAVTDPRSPHGLSGMPHQMWQALTRAAETPVVPLHVPFPSPPLLAKLARSRGTFDGSILPLERLLPRRAARRTLRVARDMGHRTQALLDAQRLDAAIVCCVTWPLFRVATRVPFVYVSDGTTWQVNATYPAFRARSRGFHEASSVIERDVLARAAGLVVASPRAAESIRAQPGLERAPIDIVPLGASLLPQGDLAASAIGDVPTRQRCRLMLVASDPIRKRVDFAVEILRELNALGCVATLDLVGAGTRRSRASPHVEHHGFLDQRDPPQAQRFRGLWARAHLAIQPSLAELFGIAVAEAAHFSKLAVVSDVGGLSHAVRHGETGLVLRADATPRDHARAILDLVDDPARYRRLCLGALVRARRELTWDAWARRVMVAVERAINRGRS